MVCLWKEEQFLCDWNIGERGRGVNVVKNSISRVGELRFILSLLRKFLREEMSFLLLYQSPGLH